jgi:hypothetical protein
VQLPQARTRTLDWGLVRVQVRVRVRVVLVVQARVLAWALARVWVLEWVQERVARGQEQERGLDSVPVQELDWALAQVVRRREQERERGLDWVPVRELDWVPVQELVLGKLGSWALVQTGVVPGSTRMQRMVLSKYERKKKIKTADSPGGTTAGFWCLRGTVPARALCFDPTAHSLSESTSEPSPFSAKPCVFAQNRYRPAMSCFAFQWLEHSERYGNSFSSM